MSNPVEFYKSLGWYVTSPFGNRTLNGVTKLHRGVDLGGFPCGAPVQTPFDGTVVAAKTSGMGTWGNTVCVKISDDYVTLNAHLASIAVKENQEVKAGDIIGYNGGTTHVGKTYACHIHFEVQKNNGSAPWRGDVWGDPEKFYLEQTPVYSDKFKVGDEIRNTLTTASVNVRHKYGTTGSITRKIEPLDVTTVLAHEQNGIYNTGYYWWYVLGGWVAEKFFEQVEPEPLPDPKPEPKPEEPGTELPAGLMELLRQLYEILKKLFA